MKKRSKASRKRYQFQVIVEKDTLRHDIARQTLRFDKIDPDSPTGDYLIYVGTVAEKTLYDDMIKANGRKIRKQDQQQLEL